MCNGILAGKMVGMLPPMWLVRANGGRVEIEMPEDQYIGEKYATYSLRTCEQLLVGLPAAIARARENLRDDAERRLAQAQADLKALEVS